MITQQKLVARALSEAELQGFILGTKRKPGPAIRLGWTVFHARDSRRQRLVGLPDLILLRSWPLPIGLEWWKLKTEVGKVSPAQMRVIALLQDCGQVVRIVRPSDWQEGRVLEWLA